MILFLMLLQVVNCILSRSVIVQLSGLLPPVVGAYRLWRIVSSGKITLLLLITII